MIPFPYSAIGRFDPVSLWHFYEFSALSLYVKKLRHGYKQPSATDKIYTEARCVPSSTIFVYSYKLLPTNLRAFNEYVYKLSGQTASAYCLDFFAVFNQI